MSRSVSKPPEEDPVVTQRTDGAPDGGDGGEELGTAATMATERDAPGPAGSPGRYSRVLSKPSRAGSKTPARGEPRPDPLIGKVIDDRYRIEAVLGAGGVGVVYRAEHVHLHNPVAIKVLNERFGQNDELRSRFEREARAQHRLKHPHIVALTDYGVADGQPYLTMELLEGRSLSAWLRENGPPDPETAIDILRQVLRGLAFAHAEGVVHRDLKPANVFLVPLPDAPHHVKLLDFGLAKMVDPDEHDPATRRGDPTLTKVGAVLGTPAYMSPEQASGGDVDPRSDVYSAGVMLFELLTGRQPFPTKERAAQLRAHLVEPVPRLSEVRPELVPTVELEAFVQTALAKDRGDRFADGGAMLAALGALPRPVGRLRATAELSASAPERSPTPSSTPGRRGNDVRRSGERPAVARSPAGAGAEPPVRARFDDDGASAGRGGLRFLAGAALVLGVAAVAFFGLRGGVSSPDEPSAAADPTAADARGGTGGAAKAKTPPAPKPPARDPFADGPGDGLGPFARKLAAGRRPSRGALRRLTQLQADRPGDPRPSLLLARAFVERGWQSDAIERYVLAYHIDPSARGDETMKRHLLDLAGKPPPVGQRAADAILEIYGPELLGPVERASERGSGSSRARYRALAARLR